LIFGPGDYAAAAGVPQLSVGTIDARYPGDQWHYVLSRIVTTARAFGVQAIDGPYAAIRDLEGYRQVAQRSRLLGFDGKWALHPDQIAVCNEVYSPGDEEYERAVRILEAYREATETDRAGAVMFEGEMIDEASRKMALGIAERGRAAGMSA
jgi:citrate lyase subunit beta/citryl-CoA lyase